MECMELSNELFDKILLDATFSPRKRMHYDLRTVAGKDTSQRMLNVLMPETVIPIHRHQDTSETVIVCRGGLYVKCFMMRGEIRLTSLF